MKNLKAIALTSLALLPAGVLAACGSGAATGNAGSSANGTASTDAQANGTTPPNGRDGGGPPGMGTEVTGTAATKAGEAATAKYAGTVERVSKLDDGSYAVMVVSSDADSSDAANGGGMQVVLVSASYEVTGLQERPTGTPPNGGQAPADGTAPTTPADSTTSSATAS